MRAVATVETSTLCRSTRPVITASRIQPTVSSATAVETMTMPIRVRNKPRSMRILAITGIAEIDIAVAMNSAKTGRSMFVGISRDGTTKPKAKPARKGRTNPPSHPQTTAPLAFRRMLKRVSSPVKSTRKMTPIHETISRRLR